MRLQKYIAHAGICSRRKAEELIEAGKVKVNNKIAAIGTKIDPEKDEIKVNGKKIYKKSNDEFIYIIINKPLDYISSTTSSQGVSVLELLKKENNIKPKFGRDIKERVYPVGRLDKDSEGLLLLTNDGHLADKLTHPKYEHKKIYEVIIDSPLTRDAKKILTKGMDIGDNTWVNGIKIIYEKNLGKRSIINVELKEGKNRQIKKMFGRIGYRVSSLKRIQFGKIKLGTLPSGRWRFLKKDQII